MKGEPAIPVSPQTINPSGDIMMEEADEIGLDDARIFKCQEINFIYFSKI